MNFIIAQILGIIAGLLSAMAIQTKSKRKYLLIYSISYVFFILNMILLKAYSGAINNVISLVLSLISMKYEKKKFPTWMLIFFVIAIFAGSALTYQNVFSILPSIATFLYLFILLSKNMRNIRTINLITKALWTIYDFISKAYTTFVIDVIALISAIIAKGRYDKKKTK